MIFAVKLGYITHINKQGSVFLQVKHDQISITGQGKGSTIQKEEECPHTQLVTDST